MSGRQSFLSQQAPDNYVAGVGRGALAFTTRSDLGPVRTGPSDEQIKEALAKRVQGLAAGHNNAGAGGAPPHRRRRNDDSAPGDDKGGDDGDDGGAGRGGPAVDPDNEFGLFAGAVYDKEDEESDKIWEWVDERMDRRKRQREAREHAERDDYERNNPKISQQFADLKRALGGVSDDEWASLPEVGDLTGKNRRSRQAQKQRFYAVPDSVLAAARDSGQMATTVEDGGAAAAAANGPESATATTPTPANGPITDFATIGAMRDKSLQVRLDQASAAGTQTVIGSATSVDPSGYISRLTKPGGGAAEVQVGDINRVRELLQSVIKTNPGNALGWIAAARLEEVAGKLLAARKLIEQGCAKCPRNQDVWLENIRLNELDVAHNAKVVARRAIEANPRSVHLWVAAMKLEAVPRDRKRVIRKALDHLPESEALWKEAVNLEEDPADARLLLAKATQLMPQSVDLWLALARLETAENAQKVLNRARTAVPTSPEIWIAAARLQEQLGNAAKVNVIGRAVKALVLVGAMPKRDEWLAEAERCEAEGDVLTCASIVRETLGYGLDEDDDRKDVWMDDARGCINRGRYETARAVYAYLLGVFVTSRTAWLAAADLERNHGTAGSLEAVLERAVAACPRAEDLWLMLAKEKWLAADVDGARRVLGRAFQQNPNNEDIWLAAVKLEAENGHEDEARSLLRTAREQAPTDRVWMKSVVFERVVGRPDAALALVVDALALFPAFDKLWMLRGQVCEDLGRLDDARDAYALGVKAAPKSVPLWLLHARLEERRGLVVKARSILDRARQAVLGSGGGAGSNSNNRNSNTTTTTNNNNTNNSNNTNSTNTKPDDAANETLWCEAVRLERRAGNAAQARTLLSRAMQAVPRSGLLWSELIWHHEARTARKPRCLEAVKAVSDPDPTLYVAVARMFWHERRLEKAQAWFEKALVQDPDRGDSWAWYAKFLDRHGTREKREDVVAKCVASEPRHGEVWARVAKAPANARLKTEEVLKLVAAELE